MKKDMKILANPFRQRGLTLSGLILALIIISFVAIIGMQVIPAVVEFQSIKKAIVEARNKGATPAEIETAFNNQANGGYITSIRGSDLTIFKEDGEYEISFAYDKKLHLLGPVSLLLEFSGDTKDQSH